MGIFSDARDSISIILGKILRTASSEVERAELRVTELAAGLSEQQRKLSDLHGTLNNETRRLDELKAVLAVADKDYGMVEGKGGQIEKDALDRVGEAEKDVQAQEEIVAEEQKIFDETRFAVALAASEIKTLQDKVKKASVKALATKTIESAAAVIQTTRDLAKASSEIGRDLDKVDEKYEQAKAKLEDSQGSEAERKLQQAKQQQEREDIKKRLDERRRAGLAS